MRDNGKHNGVIFRSTTREGCVHKDRPSSAYRAAHAFRVLGSMASATTSAAITLRDMLNSDAT